MTGTAGDCPKHWHLTCHYCGRTAAGLPTGWEADFWTGHTCPECAGTH